MKKISLLIMLLCFPLFIGACAQDLQVVNVGDPAPDFTLVDLEGKTWTLSELKGQVVFINFWATWCPPCREEMPALQRLFTMMPKDTFKMLAILNKDDPTLGGKFAKKLGVTMPILNDQANKAGHKYGLTGLPETFIVDKQGILREKFIGPAQWDSPQFVQKMKKYISM